MIRLIYYLNLLQGEGFRIAGFGYQAVGAEYADTHKEHAMLWFFLSLMTALSVASHDAWVKAQEASHSAWDKASDISYREWEKAKALAKGAETEGEVINPAEK